MKRRVGSANYYIWEMDGWCIYPTKSPIRGGQTGRGSPGGVWGCYLAQILFFVVEAGGGGPGLMALYRTYLQYFEYHTGVGGVHTDRRPPASHHMWECPV